VPFVNDFNKSAKKNLRASTAITLCFCQLLPPHFGGFSGLFWLGFLFLEMASAAGFRKDISAWFDILPPILQRNFDI